MSDDEISILQTQKIFPGCLQRITIIKTDFLFIGILSVDQERPVITSHEKISKIVITLSFIIYFSLSGFYVIKVKLAKFSKPLQNLHGLRRFPLFSSWLKKYSWDFFGEKILYYRSLLTSYLQTYSSKYRNGFFAFVVIHLL